MGYQAVIKLIHSYQKFILTAHETPDGDAIGSEYAMYSVLKKLGKTVRIINNDPAAHKYSFIDKDNVIELLQDLKEMPEDLGEYCLIILDTNDIYNIGHIRDEILPLVKQYYIIDHHEGGENIKGENMVNQDASSTCEVLYDLFNEMKAEIDYPVAEALFTGIVYDTGSFIYPKTTAKTFYIAYELVSMGVNPNYIYSKIYESNSISSLMLQSRVLSSLELVFDEQVAIQTMLKETIAKCHAMYEEADTIINVPLKSEKIRVSVFFKENEEGILRCSMRSKGNIDVAEIAQYYGGGGHKTAAGFKSKYPLEEIKEMVLEKLKPYFY